jgi:ABC-type sugar transport system permease subunit
MTAKTKQTLFGLALLAPAVLLLALLFLRPMVDLILTSLTNKNLLRPDRLNFIGLENYSWMFSEPSFWAAILRSLIFTLCVTAISVLISMGVALLMNFEFKVKRVLFALILLPWVTSYMSSAFVYKLLYDYSYGVFNYLFSDVLGLVGVQNWLGATSTAMGASIAVAVWHFLPFSILVLTNALKQVPTELFESARIDGAGNFKTFTAITLPTIKPSLITLIIVRFAAAFKTFESIYLLTQGGPGEATTTLPMWYYQIGFQSFRGGKGAAIGVTLILTVLIAYFVLIRTFGEDAI